MEAEYCRWRKGALLLELYLKIALLLDRNDISEKEQVRGAELGAKWIRDKVVELFNNRALRCRNTDCLCHLNFWIPGGSLLGKACALCFKLSC